MSNTSYATRFLEPRLLASHFLIDQGTTVTDFGAGAGTYVPSLAKKVGPSGRVITCDIQSPLVEHVGQLAKLARLSHVEPQWCDLETPHSVRIKDEESDYGILINTLYQFEDKATALSEIHRILRPGAVLYVVDWLDSYAGMGPAPEYVVAKDTAVALIESLYFVLEREYPAGAYHYGLAFRKL
jgi:ubiquinone/menaquinone biosynthesis C-methylase UbiE